MDSMWTPILCILGIIGSSTSAPPYYTVIAPKVVRPNSEYHVAISTSVISQPSTIYTELRGELESGDVFNVSQTINVDPNTTRIVTFEVGNITPGYYWLISRGLSGIQFSESRGVLYVQKAYTVFIQTDRSIYKPGSKVLFRAIVLDSKLRPVAEGIELDTYIADGQGNRVKQWKQRMDSKGVFSSELQLSDSPVLGNWKIFVNIFGQVEEKSFEIAEYVLPKFEVVIDVPRHATFKDSSITATIRAKYTYGKPIKGEATITAYSNRFANFVPQSNRLLVRKVVPMDGKAIVNFDIVSEFRFTEDQEDRSVQLEVSVEEALTGRIQNTSVPINLHRHKYTMELINTAGQYKPGLRYTAFLKIAHHDGSPVQDLTNPVNISYGDNYDRSQHKNITSMLDKHGMIRLDIYPPLEPNKAYAYLNIEAKYLNLYQSFYGPSKASAPSGTYIQAVLKTEDPTVNDYIEIEVNSTVLLKYLSYQVLGRGDILVATTIQVPETNTVSFKFLATQAMTPAAHVVVYYMRDDGDIIMDALNFQVNGILQNFVNIQTSLEETVPGGSVDLIISSKPNSYVGLLGIDQSSILLKSGNDISHEQVLKEVKSYDPSNEFLKSDRPFWHPDSFSPHEAIEDSGAIIITNGRRYPQPLNDIVADTFLDEEAYEQFPLRKRPTATHPEKPKVRKSFPETWIWEMFNTQLDGKTVLQRSVPDTITSWMLTAFSIDPIYGFGLIEEPRKLKVFQPFFISLNLPYSVIRGEVVAIQIVVFNYLNKDLTAEVVLENDGQFEFAELSNAVHDTSNQDLIRRERIEVKSNSGASVSFMIIPRELGQILIKATATSSLAGDSIEQGLLVKAEGETQYRNEAIFVDLRNSSSYTKNFKLEIPENSVSGSEHVEVSAVGDILGPSLPNLANLIKMPFGCGEQNMLNFVPNIVVINYLKTINQLTPKIHEKTLKFLEVGYQQEMTYRHADGSFSAFGMSDASGSTWLTAFVAKSFIQASEHITIEDRVIKQALQWLAAIQALNGSFPEVGQVSHRAMQGGAAKGLALTAFTLIAFLEDQDFANEYRSTINKGIQYIVGNLEGLDDIYSLSICTYVLNLAEHPQGDATFDMLRSKANQSEGYKWWSKPVPKDDENPWHSLPSSVNVEMSSYAMLTYLRRNMVADCLPILKWLVSQRNTDGGFASTQDTVIGIYALSKLGEKIASQDSNINTLFTYEGENQSSINVNSENNIILQKLTLPRETREVNITATGSGFAIIHVSYNYNLNKTGAWPLFTLKPEVDNNSDTNNLHLSICAGFIPTKETDESNMAVMEVNLPSGFTVDMDSVPSLEESQHVKRVETKNGDTMVILYFDKMIKEEYCVKVSALRTHKVAKQKPVPVSIYDYYDSSRRARVFYEPMAATLCDICEGDDCRKLCPATAEFVTTEEAVQTDV